MNDNRNNQQISNSSPRPELSIAIYFDIFCTLNTTKRFSRCVISGFSRLFICLFLVISILYIPRPLASDEIAIKAINYASKAKYTEALTLKKRLTDDIARTLIDWLYVRNAVGKASFGEIAAFVRAHPDWPSQRLIRRRAERALYLRPESNETAVDFLTQYEPLSAWGKLALGRALLAKGDTKRGASLIRESWRRHDFKESTEREILSEFGQWIGTADHRLRLVRLIYQQKRRAIIRQSKKLSHSHQKMAKAATELLRLSKKGEELYKSVQPSLRNQLVMIYPLARYYRRTDRQDKAISLVSEVPKDHKHLSFPFPWWVERRLLSRNALQRQNSTIWRQAYELARSHGYSSGKLFVQGEFLSGFIALRYLKDKNGALSHFTRLRQGDERPVNIAQAEYWLGRTHEAAGRPDLATSHFKAASKFPRTYYGQLARDKIGLGREPIRVERIRSAPQAAKDRLKKLELTRAIELMARAGQTRLLPSFFSTLAYRLRTAPELTALALLAREMKQPYLALRVAKIAATRHGIDLGVLAYPTTVAWTYRRVTPEVDEAFINALIRQESEFRVEAISGAGARGLMQIMPATGKMIARKHGLKFSRKALTRNPAYNITLGSAYMYEMLQKFGGSYIMMAAAYNAGASRVRRWNGLYGDPRKGEIDPIDWVEAIPFTETRNYVKRVMENMQVYRSILKREATPLSRDLQRGKFR